MWEIHAFSTWEGEERESTRTSGERFTDPGSVQVDDAAFSRACQVCPAAMMGDSGLCFRDAPRSRRVCPGILIIIHPEIGNFRAERSAVSLMI